jgi:hypothetical protein
MVAARAGRVFAQPVFGPDAQHAVSEELRKAEYHRNDPSFVDKAWNWVLDRLDALFSGSATGNVLLVLLVIVAAVVIFATVRAGLPRRRKARGGTDADLLRPLAATDHRRLAAELAERGDRRGALREWLRAAVQTIEDRGVLAPRPGRTGAATAREAGPLLPAAAADLRAATRAFDEVWFGGREATEADVRVARQAADTVATARMAERVEAGGFAVPR